jgi:hypothetical protein
MSIVMKGETAWRLGTVGDTTAVHFGFTGGTRGWQAANSVTELPLDEWHHIAATYDSSVGAAAWVDGVAEGTNPDPDGLATNEQPLLLGENPEATGRFYDGILDDVRIYDKALSAEEILYLIQVEPEEVPVPAPPVEPVDPGTDGLVAYYALENDATDGSGNGHDGTIVGEPVFIEGKVGMGLEFDGTGSQYVDLGTFNPSEATGMLSLSLWAKWNGLSGQWQGVIGKRDTWANAEMMWQIEANIDNGTLGFFREGSYPPDGDPVLPEGEWAHIAATFDGAVATFYFQGEATGSGDFSFGADPEAAVVFGACEANGNNPFNGALDEIKIFDRGLSAGEVLFLAGL